LAWDRTSGKLYASTAVGCGVDGSVCPFHGLITINPFTGKGKPVDRYVTNFGLPGNPSPIHSIAIDPFGHMVGWYDEKIPPATSDTYVRIDQRTGVAKAAHAANCALVARPDAGRRTHLLQHQRFDLWPRGTPRLGYARGVGAASGM